MRKMVLKISLFSLGFGLLFVFGCGKNYNDPKVYMTAVLPELITRMEPSCLDAEKAGKAKLEFEECKIDKKDPIGESIDFRGTMTLPNDVYSIVDFESFEKDIPGLTRLYHSSSDVKRQLWDITVLEKTFSKGEQLKFAGSIYRIKDQGNKSGWSLITHLALSAFSFKSEKKSQVNKTGWSMQTGFSGTSAVRLGHPGKLTTLDNAHKKDKQIFIKETPEYEKLVASYKKQIAEQEAREKAKSEERDRAMAHRQKLNQLQGSLRDINQQERTLTIQRERLTHNLKQTQTSIDNTKKQMTTVPAARQKALRENLAKSQTTQDNLNAQYQKNEAELKAVRAKKEEITAELKKLTDK